MRLEDATEVQDNAKNSAFTFSRSTVRSLEVLRFYSCGTTVDGLEPKELSSLLLKLQETGDYDVYITRTMNSY